jgi:hypothetical protein
MAPLLEDPRFRQTWNQISQNAESATETAAAGIWTFQHTYITPCLGSIASGFEQCTDQCFPDREERVRRLRERGRTRGRAELSFDFYDDWDEDETAGRGVLGGWGNDELDRLLAGSGSHSGGSEGLDQPPRRKRGMSYGTRARRKSLDPDPTVIPNTNALGFLGRLPFKLGGTLRYKPSAADLQDHPGAARQDFRDQEEEEPLMPDDESEEDVDTGKKGHTRNRSSTASSGETSDSFRSRGDRFPSDGEDDAVPLSDEFAMVLERRMTGSGTDDRSSGKTRSNKGKRPSGSRTISRNFSSTSQVSPSQSRPPLGSKRASSYTSLPPTVTPDMVYTPSLSDLQHEEERVRLEEEYEVERKREAAARLAHDRGFHSRESTEETILEAKHEPPPTPLYDIPAPAKYDSVESDEAVEATLHPQHEPSGIEDSQEPPTNPIERSEEEGASESSNENFVPARLPFFG